MSVFLTLKSFFLYLLKSRRYSTDIAQDVSHYQPMIANSWQTIARDRVTKPLGFKEQMIIAFTRRVILCLNWRLFPRSVEKHYNFLRLISKAII